MVQDSILLPILLIEHGGYSNMYMDSIKYNEITQVNRASRKAYEQIQSEGIKDVYYLSREDLNIPSGGWVDYVHPSDFGNAATSGSRRKKGPGNPAYSFRQLDNNHSRHPTPGTEHV